MCFRSLLRPSARGVSIPAVRVAAPTLIFAVSLVTARAALARPLAVARSGLLRTCDIASALRARRRDGLPDRRLRHPHARALSRGDHGGQRVERRHAAHLWSQGTGQGACSSTRDPRSHGPLRRGPVRRLDRHVRRRGLWRAPQDPVRRRLARHRRRRGHGGARVASVFTILGGAAFVIVAIRALWRRDLVRSTV